MKKYLAIILAISLLFLAACGGDNDDQSALQKKAAEKEVEYAIDAVEDAAEDAAHEASQELVNFKCDIAGMQTIYFYKEKAKIKSAYSESWLNDDGSFVVMELMGEDYLVQYPADQSEMDREGMMTTYHTSKTLDNIDCELDVVTEADVNLPDLEIVSDEEFQELLMADIMAGYEDMYAE